MQELQIWLKLEKLSGILKEDLIKFLLLSAVLNCSERAVFE